MNRNLLLLGMALASLDVLAGELPFISTSPQSTVVAPGSNVTFTVISTNALAYQWRFNGINLAWGTASSLVITNAQTNNSGYYLAIAKNTAGWTPSQLAYLSVVWSNGIVPRYNTNIAGARAFYQEQPLFCGAHSSPITNGSAQVVAGPALDQMQPVGSPRPVKDGYYGPTNAVAMVPTVNPGQTVYYRVDISYTDPCSSSTHTQASTTLQLVAGGDAFQPPSSSALRFPTWMEWPELWGWADSTVERVIVPGETVNLLKGFCNYSRCIKQWRKDGVLIPDATNATCQVSPAPIRCTESMLQLTNVQPSDAGVYDFIASAAYFDDARLSGKIYLSAFTANGQGVFRNPRVIGTDFVSDFEGAPTRNYAVSCSTNLADWINIRTFTNATGTLIFTNPLGGNTRQYYRALLLPLTFP